MKSFIKDDRRVNYGKATVPWCYVNNSWRLPSGKFTKDRNEAVNMAKRMDRIVSGRAKYEAAV
jgi:hypothetical protein